MNKRVLVAAVCVLLHLISLTTAYAVYVPARAEECYALLGLETGEKLAGSFSILPDSNRRKRLHNGSHGVIIRGPRRIPVFEDRNHLSNFFAVTVTSPGTYMLCFDNKANSYPISRMSFYFYKDTKTDLGTVEEQLHASTMNLYHMLFTLQQQVHHSKLAMNARRKVDEDVWRNVWRGRVFFLCIAIALALLAPVYIMLPLTQRITNVAILSAQYNQKGGFTEVLSHFGAFLRSWFERKQRRRLTKRTADAAFNNSNTSNIIGKNRSRAENISDGNVHMSIPSTRTYAQVKTPRPPVFRRDSLPARMAQSRASHSPIFEP